MNRKFSDTFRFDYVFGPNSPIEESLISYIESRDRALVNDVKETIDRLKSKNKMASGIGRVYYQKALDDLLKSI